MVKVNELVIAVRVNAVRNGVFAASQKSIVVNIVYRDHAGPVTRVLRVGQGALVLPVCAAQNGAIVALHASIAVKTVKQDRAGKIIESMIGRYRRWLRLHFASLKFLFNFLQK